jgi:hypothetical protein
MSCLAVPNIMTDPEHLVAVGGKDIRASATHNPS